MSENAEDDSPTPAAEIDPAAATEAQAAPRQPVPNPTDQPPIDPDSPEGGNDDDDDDPDADGDDLPDPAYQPVPGEPGQNPPAE